MKLETFFKNFDLFADTPEAGCGQSLLSSRLFILWEIHP
jgi:hypothetical protein